MIKGFSFIIIIIAILVVRCGPGIFPIGGLASGVGTGPIPTKFYAGTLTGGISISKNSGSSWTKKTSGQNGFATSSDVPGVSASGNTVAAGTLNGISISTNSGSS